MSSPARRRATFEDVLALPEHVVGEIVDGELVTSPRPSFSHAAVTTGLAAALAPPFQYGDGGPGGWWILVEPELHLGEDVVVPDVGGWRRERLPVLSGVPFTEVVPDWVCEILSPSTGRFDRARKMPLYARRGVQHAWVIDPATRTLEVLRLEGGRWVIVGAHGGDDVVRAEPFAEVEIALARWWD
jgi:Uma2 family endonuclease